jgi:hypothetical protein
MPSRQRTIAEDNERLSAIARSAPAELIAFLSDCTKAIAFSLRQSDRFEEIGNAI